MKFRKGFVSNSSSSSFVVQLKLEEQVVIDPPEFEEELKGYRKSNMNRLNSNRYTSEPQEIEKSIQKMLGLVKRRKAPLPQPTEVDPKFGNMISNTRRFELVDPANNHQKFWEIAIFEKGYITHWGRIGAKPNKTPKYTGFSPREETSKLINEKTRKGYTLQGRPVITY